MVSICKFVKDINNKYLNFFEMINFGIMFLLIEGFYFEVVRNVIFFDSLRCDENIVVVGLLILFVLLNLLFVGFKILNI